MKVKQIMAVLAASLIAVGAYAQGVVNFASGSGAKCYYTNYGGLNPTTPYAWTNGLVADEYGVAFGLYYSLNTNAVPNPGATPDSFTLVAGTASVSTVNALAGQFAAVKAIPGTDGGVSVIIQARAWSGGYASYEAALASGVATVATGFTVPVVLTLGGGSTTIGTPNFYNGGSPILTPFFISTPVPEPSVVALGVLGLLGVLFIRRRK